MATKFKDGNFYFSDEWTATKARIKERDGNKCAQCGSVPDEWSSQKKLAVHHKVQRKNGGADTDENLTTLCFACHGKLPRESR